MLGYAHRSGSAADGAGGLLSAQTDHDAQDQDFALPVGQNLEQLAHPGQGIGFDGRLLRTGLARLALGNGFRGIGEVAAGGPVCVGHLVGGDAVHKGQERAPAITVTRQRHEGGQTHLLCHVISRKTAPLDGADSCAAVSNHDRADRLQHFSKRIPITR